MIDAHYAVFARRAGEAGAFPVTVAWLRLPLQEKIEQGKRLVAECRDSDAPIARRLRHEMPRLFRETPAVEAEPPVDLPGELAVITCYYNPFSYRSRRDNYQRFSDALWRQGIEPWTIELACGGAPFGLPPNDRTQRVRSSVMFWQKERLLNLLVRKLPPQYDKVAWVDADILFDNDEWPQQTCDVLARSVVAQPFAFAQWLDRDGRQQPWNDHALCYPSVGYVTSRKQPFDRGHPGLAWAARRSFFEFPGLYDRHIAGSGDLMMVFGFFGSKENWLLKKYNAPMAAHVSAWGAAAQQIVRGRVSYVEGGIRHLWHGSREDRRYNTRTLELAKLGFDPARHLEDDPETGLLRWSAAAPPALIDYVSYYMASRREDG